MKAPLLAIVVALLFEGAYCQDAYYVPMTSSADNERTTLIRNSVSVSEWHEKSFWSLYDRYRDDVGALSVVTNLSVDSLLHTTRRQSQAGFRLASRILTNQRHIHEILKGYVLEMSATLSGTNALEFLQTELIMNVLDNLKRYEQDSVGGYNFYPWLHTADTINSAKHDAIIRAVHLEPDETSIFFAVYGQYENECDDVLGENYNLYELFNENPGDFSPGIAKMQGSNLLQLLQRENALKEKYFIEMNAVGGASLASRFVLWEDYYSTVNKMYALYSGSK